MNLIEIKELLSENSGTLLAIVAVAMTLIEVTPIKVNPWSAIARWIGKVFNGEVLKKLDVMEKAQHETRERLDEHIRIDNERDASNRRRTILRFDADLIDGKTFTKEYFTDMLIDIDEYERYCNSHPEYKNSRAVLAIEHIKDVCAEFERTNGFAR